MISAPWCPAPAEVTPHADPKLAVGSTGWIYVGSRIGGQWQQSPADGIEPALTINVNGFPVRGRAYSRTTGVYLREALPEITGDRPIMAASRGTLPEGSVVKVDNVKQIQVEHPRRAWVWAHVTLVK
jgi:hypothetical protein